MSALKKYNPMKKHNIHFFFLKITSVINRGRSPCARRNGGPFACKSAIRSFHVCCVVSADRHVFQQPESTPLRGHHRTPHQPEHVHVEPTSHPGAQSSGPDPRPQRQQVRWCHLSTDPASRHGLLSDGKCVAERQRSA